MESTYNTVIVGSGPAGLFCAGALAAGGREGILILDGGRSMWVRHCPHSPACSCRTCHVLEGEGGAGGFSDGKKTYSLTRGTQQEDLLDPTWEYLLNDIDVDIVRHSPSPGVMYTPREGSPPGLDLRGFSLSSYPLRHIGSDGVRGFIVSYTGMLRQLGVQINLDSPVLTYSSGGDGDVIVRTSTGWARARTLVLATGIQGWTWMEGCMANRGIPMQTGPASVGMRYETDSRWLAPLFDWFYDFKLERDGLRSFCANSGGKVINEHHRLLGVRCVNGESFLEPSLRTTRSNFAILAKINSDGDPKRVVRDIGRRVNALAAGQTAAQAATDFLEGKPSLSLPARGTNTQAIPRVDIGEALPGELRDRFRAYIEELEAVLKIPAGTATIYAPEVKYAGYRVPIDRATFRLLGEEGRVYVVGNATGYLDSFVSAALTGIIAAKDIMKES